MKLRKAVLGILASMPFGIVSFAAKASLQDGLDQEAVGTLRKSIDQKRHLIFEMGSTVSSIGEARERYNGQTDVKPSVEKDADFWSLVNEMETKGMLQRHGEYLLARAPSQW